MVSSSSASTKRVALITGCSEPSSIGAATALYLLSRGWRVFATARKAETLSALRDSGCDVLALDIVNQESVNTARDTLLAATNGRLDLLINNAGVTATAPALHTDPVKMAAMFDVNVLGALRMVQAFSPALINTANAKDGKRSKIVNIGSVISTGAPWHTAYAATKAAIQSMSDVMRKELSPLGIDVITLELGLVQTAMTTQTKDFDIALNPLPATNHFSNWTEIITEVGKYFKAETKKAPTAGVTAKAMVDAIEQKVSPPKIWLGYNSTSFRFLFPTLPIRFVDGIWSKLMRTDLVSKRGISS